MSLFNLHTGYPLQKGCILIAEPIMQDIHFHRSLIILTHHDETGSMGFIINQSAHASVSIEDAMGDAWTGRISSGGPVATDTLHIMHTCADLPDAVEIVEGVYWGGDVAQLVSWIKMGLVDETAYKMFVGYAGWEPGQLQSEIDDNTWLISPLHTDLIWGQPQTDTWKEAIRRLGGGFQQLLFVPDNPSFN